VTLPARRHHGKRPFSTQLRPETLARLEWVRRRGYVLNDTVDEAINAYLDAAGVPRADESGNIIEQGGSH
jgi:DNA-binding IclR family transcriptional regulator